MSTPIKCGWCAMSEPFGFRCSDHADASDERRAAEAVRSIGERRVGRAWYLPGRPPEEPTRREDEPLVRTWGDGLVPLTIANLQKASDEIRDNVLPSGEDGITVYLEAED